MTASATAPRRSERLKGGVFSEDHIRIAISRSLGQTDAQVKDAAENQLEDLDVDSIKQNAPRRVFARRRKRGPSLRNEADSENDLDDEQAEIKRENQNDNDNDELESAKEQILSTDAAAAAAATASTSLEHKKKKTSKNKRSARGKRKKRRTNVVHEQSALAEVLSGPGSSKDLTSEGEKGADEEVYLLVDDEEASCPEQTEERKHVKFAYPSCDDPDAVEVNYSDLQCLEENQYINDTVVHVYIKFIQKPQLETHVFSSFFFSKLDSLGSELTPTKLERLRKWMNGVNIFEKTYLLMPIHDRLHWSLAIICFAETKRGCCHILHLDSMKTGHESRHVYSVLRRYLTAEWTSCERLKGNLKKPHVRKVKVPQQENEYDCGLFMLHFIEKFLSNAPSSFNDDMHKQMFDWFSLPEASKLRTVIRELLKGILENQTNVLATQLGDNNGLEVVLPITGDEEADLPQDNMNQSCKEVEKCPDNNNIGSCEEAFFAADNNKSHLDNNCEEARLIASCELNKESCDVTEKNCQAANKNDEDCEGMLVEDQQAAEAAQASAADNETSSSVEAQAQTTQSNGELTTNNESELTNPEATPETAAAAS